jgi:hypothetical protein
MAAVLVDLPAAPPKSEEPAELAFEDDLRKEILGKADSFIEDAISRLDWEQMQELMAGILWPWATAPALPHPDPTADTTSSPPPTAWVRKKTCKVARSRQAQGMFEKHLSIILFAASDGQRCLHLAGSRKGLLEARQF